MDSIPAGRVPSERGAGGNPIREFLGALADPHTYLPRENPYSVFGFLWGIPVPFFSCAIDCWVSGHNFGIDLLTRHPIHLLFLLHPFLFAVVFGAMGTVRRNKDAQIAGLISELERHVKELADAYARLQELDLLKAQFVANVTHELKTPLVAIRGYNEAILGGRFGPLTEKQRDGLAISMRNIERLQRLIGEVLEFERIDSGDLRIERSDFDLVPVVQETVRNFAPRLEARRLTVALDLPPTLPVNADREKISRVLLNLVSNAVKFSAEGGRLGVEVRIEEADHCARVIVWDHGRGIPPDLQKHLFTRFWQATRGLADKADGTGLGLVITKGILDAHGSTIQVFSEPGAGTRLQFRLPLAKENGRAVSSPFPEASVGHPAVGLPT